MTVPKKVEEGKPRFRWGIPLFSTLCAAILVFMVYALTHRYTLATSSDGAVYQTDRMTGKTWKMEGATMKEVVEATPTPAPNAAKELPEADLDKLDGKGDCICKYGDWRFEASIKNPTDWEITEMRIHIAGEFYSLVTYIEPRSWSKIQIDKLRSYTPVEGNIPFKCTWLIVTAKGTKLEQKKSAGK